MSLRDFIKPTKEKTILALILAIILVTLIFSMLPTYREIFLSRSLLIKIFDIVVNVLILTLIFYPVSCVIVFVYHKLLRKV